MLKLISAYIAICFIVGCAVITTPCYIIENGRLEIVDPKCPEVIILYYNIDP